MTDLKKIQDQLGKAMSELKELNSDETQLAYDYIEYANILVKNLIIADVVKSFYCYDKTVANAEEDYDFKQCDKQCEKCKQ
jgi:hypothetical protein